MKQNRFLTAEWRKLIMANYSIDPLLLKGKIPAKTELDYWNNKVYVSLVGFMFMNTKVRGIKIPFHINFPEVNLRFYVRYKENGQWKRGVVFIKEIVPKRMISFVANTLFYENYSSMSMKYKWQLETENLFAGYYWKKGNNWNSLEVNAGNISESLREGSREEFITEHFYGYSHLKHDKTAEYRVDHPRWSIYKVNDHNIVCDFENIYGNEFGVLKEKKPESVFLAEGSPVSVFMKKIL